MKSYILAIIALIIVADIYIMFSPDESPKKEENIQTATTQTTPTEKTNLVTQKLKKSPIHKPPVTKTTQIDQVENVNNNIDTQTDIKTSTNNVNTNHYTKSTHINYLPPAKKKIVQKKIQNGDLTPLYNEWKTTKNGKKYNIFITTNPSTPQKSTLTPPKLPNIITTKVDGKKVAVVVPENSEAYIAIKDSSKKNNESDENNKDDEENIEYQDLKDKSTLLAPPQIGE